MGHVAIPSRIVLIVSQDVRTAAEISARLAQEQRGPHAGAWTTRRADLPSAEQLLRTGGIDVVIIDMDLVGTPGLDALESLRDASPATPMVALVGTLARHDESALYLAGALEIIRRPIPRSVEISSALRRAIVRETSTRDRRHAREDLAIAISTIVHDLINPLTTIELCAAALVPHGPPPAREHRMADLIQQSAELMHHVIRDLSDRADLELGRLQLERQLLDVREIAAVVEYGMAPTARQRRVALAAQCDDGLPAVLADRDRLVRSLCHIIGAALAIARPGERVELSVRGMQDETLTRSRGRSEPSVQFTVRHVGSGTAVDEVMRIGTDPRSGVTRSTGIGLPLAKALIEAHGGSMDIMNAAGQGMMFSFSLPALGNQNESGASG